MTTNRYGIWLIGARGGIGTSLAVGWAALEQQIAPEIGLVSALPQFSALPLPAWEEFVFGGHEIRATTLTSEASQLHSSSRVFDHELLQKCREKLEAIEANVRPGMLWRPSEAVSRLAPQLSDPPRRAREFVERAQADLLAFREHHHLDDVVVVNLASTEPPVEEALWPQSWDATRALLDRTDCPLPASSLYAIAALELGLPYINFTPSLGSTPPGIDELARHQGTCHAGRDGKTGETLLKSVLAPMFARRNLEVMSWVGHNIFGNLDGVVLDDPQNKQSKVKSKDQLLEKILGYTPQTLVSIEHIGSLGDWKTAWDHVHFRGFLGTPMTLQFTWQGCDSLLAAPLVLDLVRFTRVARARGETGALAALSSFFKSPLGETPQEFDAQFQLLERWARESGS